MTRKPRLHAVRWTVVPLLLVVAVLAIVAMWTWPTTGRSTAQKPIDAEVAERVRGDSESDADRPRQPPIREPVAAETKETSQPNSEVKPSEPPQEIPVSDVSNEASESYRAWRAAWPDAELVEAPRWSGEWPPIPEDVLTAKYDGYTIAQLRQARDAASKAAQEAMHSGFGELYNQGQFDTRFVTPGQPVRTGMSRSNAPLMQYRRVNGGSEIHIVVLPFDLYSHVYDLKNESTWLAAKIGSDAK